MDSPYVKEQIPTTETRWAFVYVGNLRKQMRTWMNLIIPASIMVVFHPLLVGDFLSIVLKRKKNCDPFEAM